MRKPWHIWVAFGLCLVIVFAAMAWISRTALQLERAEAQANRAAEFEERCRLALWRMDSALTPLITRESSRPYFTYTSFHPVNRAYTRMFAEIRPDEILVPSELLTFRSEFIRLHFQYGPGGKLTSPQVPTGNQCDLAETGYVEHKQVLALARRLDELGKVLTRQTLLGLLPAPEPAAPVAVAPANNEVVSRRGGRDPVAQQQALNTIEHRMRNVSAQYAQAPVVFPGQRAGVHQTVREGPVQALWCDGELLLARRVVIGAAEYVQGCWLDWPFTRQWLLTAAKDLLPEAHLEAASTPQVPQLQSTAPGLIGAGPGQTHRLAALPVVLLPGVMGGDGAPAYSSPLRMSLAIAWGCVLAGAAAVALLLRGLVVLSERRGAFVSAVTHELRTPLTTFRLYADMLAEGMVTDQAKHTDYVRRLRDESDRLSHLVENVLAYARLSRERAGDRMVTVPLGELVERMTQRLEARAERAKMRLCVEDVEAAADTAVLADVSAVEQILLNLVDNACKYAARASEPTVHVQFGAQGGYGLIRVRDHGPGISASQADRLFRPFSKSAREAAHSAPGIGLGLALSRRLARDMGGDLRLDGNIRNGACFVLSLEAV